MIIRGLSDMKEEIKALTNIMRIGFFFGLHFLKTDYKRGDRQTERERERERKARCFRAAPSVMLDERS
jgi:hypothetical protein